MAGPIAALAMQLMQEQVAKNPDQFKQPESVVESRREILTPERVHTLGGLADAASTYYFARTGTKQEMNPLLKGVKNPEMLGLSALGGLAATKALAALIRKKYPRVADALQSNLGGEQMILTIHNLDRDADSFDEYRMVMDRYQTRKK